MNITKKFSIIIPTMWRCDLLLKMLEKYEINNQIEEIILIDNNPIDKPDLNRYKKIIYFTNGKNNFVNPSWNLGYSIAKNDIILANDDIFFEDLEKVINLFTNTDCEIIGLSTKNTGNGIRIERIKDFPANNYGCFMYVKNYNYIPEKYKIWYGDKYLFESVEKRGILMNSNVVLAKSQTVNFNKNELRKTIANQDTLTFSKDGFDKKKLDKKLSVLAVLVNFGKEQLNFLESVVKELKSFKNFDVKVIVNSNIPIQIPGIDKVNIFNTLDNFELLPLTCRSTILENVNKYDIYIYGENDHLFLENHLIKHIEYSKILPKNRISGLIQYEENEKGKFYPAYHGNYDWDFNSVETYEDKKFAHFTNLHQASFILTNEQLNNIVKKHNFNQFFGKSNYSVKCKVNTDIFQFCDMKKVICITEFKDNLIHHLPNLYIEGEKGRKKYQNSGSERMNNSILKLFGNKSIGEKIVCGVATTYDRKNSLKDSVLSIINQVDELIVYQNDYYEIFDFLKNSKIKVISSKTTEINKGDAGKFYLVGQYPNCYYLTIDDDIVYPVDYVSSIISGLKKYNNNVVVTHHGRTIKKDFRDYYKDYENYYHYNSNVSNYNKVDMPGTGVMGFHTAKVPILFSDFVNPNMADIIVGTKMKKIGIDCICLPHQNNWLKDSENYNKKNTLFNKNKNNNLVNSYIINKFIPIKNLSVSVIIPTFNNTKYIDESLNTIINSGKNHNIEILVGIDGCEKTLNHIKQKTYPDFVKFYYFTTNNGPYDIKNSLTQISNSDNLLFFDSDDIMMESTISEIISNIGYYDMVRLKYKEIIDGKIQDKKENYHEGNFAIKKSIFLSMNGFEPWMCAADSDFLSRLYRRKPRIFHTKNLSVYYRRHSDSLTKRSDTGMASKLRGNYAKISKNKKGDGNPLILHTRPFELVTTETFVVTKEYDAKLEIRNQKIDLIFNRPTRKNVEVSPQKKQDPVILDRLDFLYNNKPEPVRIIKTNKPNNRQELIDKKNGTTKNTINEMFKVKPNHREGKNFINLGSKFNR